MHATLSVLFAIFLILGAVGPAAAQQPQNPLNAPSDWLAQLDTYLARPAFRNEVRYFVQEFERMRRGQCNQVNVVDVQRVPKTPIEFDATGTPSRGVWQIQIVVNRCGQNVIHNVRYRANVGKVIPEGMFPGETLVPLEQQDGVAVKMRDFLKRMIPATDCRLFVIMDTRMERPPGPNSGGRWTERWTIQQCERRDDVLIDFAVQPNGFIDFEYRMG